MGSPLHALHGDTLPMRYARNAIRYAQSQGASEKALLAAAELDPARLAVLDGRIDAVQMAALWEAATTQTGDPDFGLHLGAQAQPGTVSIVGYLMLSANTLGDALGALARYTPLLGMLRGARLDHGGPRQAAAFEMTAPRSGALAVSLRQPMEAGMMMVAAFSRAVTGHRLPILAAAFAHSRPATGTATHQALFGVTPTFDAACYRLEFEASALRWPGRSASPELHAAFSREAELALSRLKVSVRSRAAASIETSLLGAVPSLSEVAIDLAMGERTLQRNLEEEGTTFQKVVDEVRRDLATRHLGEESMAIHEVAFLLGYSSPSAFHRAFKRWTDLTPTAYCAQARAQAPSPTARPSPPSA